MRRRSVLAAGAALAGLAVAGTRPDRAAVTPPEPVGTILAGTRHETPVYEIEGDADGPTAVVIGGVHGDERSGYLAAERVLEWSLATGRLVVVPRANQVAIQRNSREGVGGDLNRQFTPGQPAGTRLARALWARIEDADPDVVLNLHSSKGIYGFHPEFVGQALFPSEVGDAVPHVEEVVSLLNEQVVPWHMPYHDFSMGNVVRGSAPLLAHKVNTDLERPAYIVEVTKFLLDSETGARWTERAVAELLDRHGLVRAGDDP